MDHGQLNMVADKFQWVFSESLLNACGKDAKFCRRERIITPLRLGLALTATCASQRVETLADFHRGFNALWGTSITYKAFSNQVAKTHFADFARTMTARLIGEMTLKVETIARTPGYFHPARASCKACRVWSRPSPWASRHISSAMRALICSCVRTL